MTMLNQLKETYGNDVKACLQAGIDSDIASPTTRARLEWAIEEIERLDRDVRVQEIDIQRLQGEIREAWADGYDSGWEDGENR